MKRYQLHITARDLSETDGVTRTRDAGLSYIEACKAADDYLDELLFKQRFYIVIDRCNKHTWIAIKPNVRLEISLSQEEVYVN